MPEDPDMPRQLMSTQELFGNMINETCVAVCGYIGLTWGWKLVADPWRKRDHARMQEMWSRLPTASQDIIKEEAKRAGYKPPWSDNLLPLSWLTKKQLQARRESFVTIAMRAVSHEDWLKR